MAIVQALQGLAADRPWRCVVGRRAQSGEFFRQTGSDCTDGWLSRRVVAEDPTISDISVEFVVRLSAIQEWLFASFVLIQLILAALLTRAVRRLESLKLQHEIEIAGIARRVSHDIRTPLSTLRLAMGTFHELDPERRTLVDSALGQIAAIAEDLLKKSRRSVSVLETAAETETETAAEPGAEALVGALKGQPTTTRANEASSASLEQIETMLREIVSLRKLANPDIRFSLEFERPENLGAIQWPVSTPELRRTVENLVQNSAEAVALRREVEPHSAAFISLTALIEQTKGGPPSFELTIRDSGFGVSPEIRSQLFEPGSTFGKKNGNGVALAEAKAFLERVGGSIELLPTEAGRGAAFRIRLTG
jgi:signal transduction histidine kinase